jgi:hypothetical protein
MPRRTLDLRSLLLGAAAVVGCARETSGIDPVPAENVDATPPARDLAPRITRGAYFLVDGAPHMLFAGEDPGASLYAIRVEFLDEAGRSIATDNDGDGNGDDSLLDVAAEGRTRDGRFVVRVRGSRGADPKVAAITAMPVAEDGTRGPVTTIARASRPIREDGEACDPDGFDLCADGSICDAEGASPRCRPLAEARASRCAAAPVIDLVAGKRITIAGTTGRTSAWDPQLGCANPEAIGFPEAIVRLRIAAPLPRLLLSTLPAGTSFDATLTLLGSCGDGPILACNDDGPTPPNPTLALEGVAPGEYVVAIDSLDERGGTFELEASSP